MKLYILLVFFAIIFSSSTTFAQTMRAKTESGRDVLLNRDGTWKFYSKEDNATQNTTAFNRPAAATKLFKGKKGTYGIWVNEKKWKVVPESRKENEDAEFELEHAEGEAWSLIIFERIPMTLETLKKVAVANIQDLAQNAEIVKEERRKVNGADVLCLEIETTVESIPVVYYNYYYVGNAGTIQYITYTSGNLFNEYANDFEELLNGFEVYVK